MMRLAQVISVLGHPLFMPLYAFGLLIYTNPYINMMVPKASKYFTLGILVVFTIILPILTARFLSHIYTILLNMLRTNGESSTIQCI